MSDDGIYRKYNVTRTDGSSGPGGKHEHCAYFVLDLDHDEIAIDALCAYRDAVKRINPDLANDLDEIIMAYEDRPRCHCREACCPHSMLQALSPSASDTTHELMNKAGRR